MTHLKGLGLAVMRINRYIMECKWIPLGSPGYIRPELIDTLWNVNYLSHRVKYVTL